MVIWSQEVIHRPPYDGPHFGLHSFVCVVVVVVRTARTSRAGGAAPVPHVSNVTRSPIEVGQARLAVNGAP